VWVWVPGLCRPGLRWSGGPGLGSGSWGRLGFLVISCLFLLSFTALSTPPRTAAAAASSVMSSVSIYFSGVASVFIDRATPGLPSLGNSTPKKLMRSLAPAARTQHPARPWGARRPPAASSQQPGRRCWVSPAVSLPKSHTCVYDALNVSTTVTLVVIDDDVPIGPPVESGFGVDVVHAGCEFPAATRPSLLRRHHSH
jgi:hypothetical protein